MLKQLTEYLRRYAYRQMLQTVWTILWLKEKTWQLFHQKLYTILKIFKHSMNFSWKFREPPEKLRDLTACWIMFPWRRKYCCCRGIRTCNCFLTCALRESSGTNASSLTFFIAVSSVGSLSMHAKYAPQAASAWILKFNPWNGMKQRFKTAQYSNAHSRAILSGILQSGEVQAVDMNMIQWWQERIKLSSLGDGERSVIMDVAFPISP